MARPLSLYPLKFDEALTDVLKIKPEPKPSPSVKAERKGSAKKRKPASRNRTPADD